LEIGLEYILNNKKERVRKINDFMYFLIKNNKVVYIGFGNSINSLIHENKDYDSYCTIKDTFGDKERMEVFKENLKLYKPHYNLECLPDIQWGKWALKCNDDRLEDIEVYPTHFINGLPIFD